MYKELNFQKVITTITKLENRIKERFPDSSISRVSEELHETAKGAQSKIEDIAKPNLWIRAGVIVTITSFIILLIYTFSVFEWKLKKPGLVDIIQITEALINDVLLVGAALFFLISFETRTKRKSVLEALHQLRSIAHVIDMHQLTKDPTVITRVHTRTANSPERTMSAFELQRYLDYCAEMLSLIGKIAALYSEHLPEPEIVSAANDIESLCTGLSQKVWQKLVFLNNGK